MEEGSRRVLVVDDDPFVREILTFILEAGGFSVDTAEDGVDAFGKLIGGSSYHVMVSDMNMPEMSGLELTRKLRESGVSMPIVVLTGDGEIPAAMEAVHSGANAYLVKDENLQDVIIDSLERVMEAHDSKG